MNIETRYAGLRLLLDFCDDGSGSADVEFGLDTEARLESLFYSVYKLGAGRDRDHHLALPIGRLYRSFPFDGPGWFCLSGMQPSRSEQGEVSQPAEPQEDF